MQCWDSFVFVHGLDGDALKSWTHTESGKCWIKEFLPNALPDARILAYGYDANTFGSSQATLTVLGEALARDLTIYREGTQVTGHLHVELRLFIMPFLQSSDRPVVFLAHSLGGLVVKSASDKRTICRNYTHSQ
jgi:hypothetical protein